MAAGGEMVGFVKKFESLKASSTSVDECRSPKNAEFNKNGMKYAEDHLLCSICTELFIKAVTLNCSHTFCKYCIYQWKEKKSQCPICRVKIKIMLPIMVLDNYIESLLQDATAETISHRITLLEEREGKEIPNRTINGLELDDDEEYETFSDGSDEGNFDYLANELIQYTLGTIYLDDANSADMLHYESSVEEEEDDGAGASSAVSYEYNGLPGAHYGGYGHCFNCGQTGHWRNGCPFRRKPYYGGYGRCFNCGQHGHWANSCNN